MIFSQSSTIGWGSTRSELQFIKYKDRDTVGMSKVGPFAEICFRNPKRYLNFYLELIKE